MPWTGTAGIFFVKNINVLDWNPGAPRGFTPVPRHGGFERHGGRVQPDAARRKYNILMMLAFWAVTRGLRAPLPSPKQRHLYNTW
jgi:hypothetical protein